MTKRFIISSLLSVIAVTGCGSPEVAQHEPSAVALESHRSDEDIAVDTLVQMLEVAEQGDWEAYVDRYYGEQHKFRSPADRDALVSRFEEKWGQQIVPGLRLAATLPVRIEGDIAAFREGDDTVFALHRGNAGDWKFHL